MGSSGGSSAYDLYSNAYEEGGTGQLPQFEPLDKCEFRRATSELGNSQFLVGVLLLEWCGRLGELPVPRRSSCVGLAR